MVYERCQSERCQSCTLNKVVFEDVSWSHGKRKPNSTLRFGHPQTNHGSGQMAFARGSSWKDFHCSEAHLGVSLQKPNLTLKTLCSSNGLSTLEQNMKHRSKDIIHIYIYILNPAKKSEKSYCSKGFLIYIYIDIPGLDAGFCLAGRCGR